MKKSVVIFVLAVIAPCLVLAVLALRSLDDQQYVLERQQAIQCSAQTALLAAGMQGRLEALQREFSEQVNQLLANEPLPEVSRDFHQLIRDRWPLAEIGFVVSLQGEVLAPPLTGAYRCPDFRLANDKFFCNTESVEVYWNSPKGRISLAREEPPAVPPTNSTEVAELWAKLKNAPTKSAERKVAPVTSGPAPAPHAPTNSPPSDLVSSEAEFRQLVGDAREGMFARFLQNQLHVMLWYRSGIDPLLVFGAQLDLPQLSDGLAAALMSAVEATTSPLAAPHVAVALLDDRARPVAVWPTGFRADWNRPFAATEIGEALPHWEIAAYLVDPRQTLAAARLTRWTLGGLTLLLITSVALGGWLIVADVRRQLAIARQKTDFVSNVSHELKTPLTSIRMFAELLAARADLPDDKRRSYAAIINNESGRLTRLINNVLDFARLDRGDTTRALGRLDLVAVVREAWSTHQPLLAAAGFTTELKLPAGPVWIRGNRDGTAQILVNLLGNAEKFSRERREITVELGSAREPGLVELRVLDRGAGVPDEARERIFEQFYRANDSLANGVGGVGLGLTLARQIARQQAGDVIHQPRAGGGSAFVLLCRCDPPPAGTEPGA